MNTTTKNWIAERRQQGFTVTTETRDGRAVFTAEKTDGEFWVFGGSIDEAGRLINWR